MGPLQGTITGMFHLGSNCIAVSMAVQINTFPTVRVCIRRLTTRHKVSNFRGRDLLLYNNNYYESLLLHVQYIEAANLLPFKQVQVIDNMYCIICNFEY